MHFFHHSLSYITNCGSQLTISLVGHVIITDGSKLKSTMLVLPLMKRHITQGRNIENKVILQSKCFFPSKEAR
jgi:hypothetical protein